MTAFVSDNDGATWQGGLLLDERESSYPDGIQAEDGTKRLAAAELQTYVERISGARLPIRAERSTEVSVQIYVGENPHAAKLGVTADGREHGAYRIVSGNDWLALVGNAQISR